IGGALVAWILGLYGYVNKEGLEAGIEIVQPESVTTGAKMLVSVYPSITFFLAAGLLFFYVINKKTEVSLEEELRIRRAQTDLKL
ncbi:MAG: MFS transporter, partial [Prolixibacteraceae bacterium]|nr:MFS transporter [Prolixibacteraceae bacterium]